MWLYISEKNSMKEEKLNCGFDLSAVYRKLKRIEIKYLMHQNFRYQPFKCGFIFHGGRPRVPLLCGLDASKRR